MIVRDYCNRFDFAYRGFQYPLPPSWKYAVRLEDQIQWLLQAVLFLNCNGVSSDELDDLRRELQSYTDGAVDALETDLNAKINDVWDAICALSAQTAAHRNPVTGHRDWAYVVSKQMYDMLRYYSMTYEELEDLGMTYDQIKAEGHSWFEVDNFANCYWGDGTARVKFTPTNHIDVRVPGYFPLCLEMTVCPGGGTSNPDYDPDIGRTYYDLASQGFVKPDGTTGRTYAELAGGFVGSDLETTEDTYDELAKGWKRP